MLFVMVLLAHFFLIASVIVCLGGHRDQEPSSGEFSAESCSSSSLSEDKSTRKVAGDSTARGRRERVKHKKRGRGSKAKKSHHSLKREKRNGGKKSITKKQNVKEEQLKEKESEDSSSPEDIYAEDTINECKSEWGKEMPYIKASGKQLGLKQGKKSRDYLPLALDDTPSSPNGLDPACEQIKDIPSSSDIFNLSREQKTQTLPIEYDEKEKIKSKNVTEKTTRKDQCAFHSAEKLQKESEMYVEQKTQRCNSEKRKEVGQFSQHYLHTPVLKLPRQKLMGCTHTTDNKPPSKFSSKICPGTSLHGKNLQGSSENLELGFFNAGSKEKLTSSSSQGVQSRESMKNLALKQRSKTFSNERIRSSFAENKVPLCNEATQRSLEGGDIMRHDFMRGGKVQSKESLRSTNDLLGQNYKPKRVLPERNRVMQSQDVISSDSAESRKQSKDKFQSDEGYKFKSVSSESKVIGQSSEDEFLKNSKHKTISNIRKVSSLRSRLLPLNTLVRSREVIHGETAKKKDPTGRHLKRHTGKADNVRSKNKPNKVSRKKTKLFPQPIKRTSKKVKSTSEESKDSQTNAKHSLRKKVTPHKKRSKN